MKEVSILSAQVARRGREGAGGEKTNQIARAEKPYEEEGEDSGREGEENTNRIN